VFNLHGNERLAAWKQFRDNLESSKAPFLDVAEFWAQAPFVSSYLDPHSSTEWPDPWHLVLDLRLDNLAIALGMLYTIKLTQRFIDTPCEIHMSMSPNNKEANYFLVVDNKYVLNKEYKNVVGIDELKGLKTNIIWSKSRM
jgi:hypothetical protein